jgi:hypothetical protein
VVAAAVQVEVVQLVVAAVQLVVAAVALWVISVLLRNNLNKVRHFLIHSTLFDLQFYTF